MKNIYGQVKIRLYNDKIEINTGAKNGKLTLLAIDNNYCVIKENAYTGYVHRGIGSTPTPPHIHIYIVKTIYYYKHYKRFYKERYNIFYIFFYIQLFSNCHCLIKHNSKLCSYCTNTRTYTIVPWNKNKIHN